MWISKSIVGFPGRFANAGRLGFRSGEQRGGKSLQLYFFPLVPDCGIFFTDSPVTEVASGRWQRCG